MGTSNSVGDVERSSGSRYRSPKGSDVIWRLPSRKAGRRFLGAWIARALATGLTHMVALAKSLRKHRHGLLAYFDHRISTGPLEGMNNKIKVLKRQAYGFRDIEYFKLRLAFIHESTPAFAG